MGLIQWRSVRWRGGDGFSGFIDGDMTFMIFPATPDRNLPSSYGMFIFSELYDQEACRTGLHIAIPLESIEEGKRQAEESLMELPNRH